MVVGDDFGGTAVVTNSNFSDNTGFYGGAIAAVSVSMSGSTFSSNSALWSGGAITAGYIDIESSKFTRNSALRGGAIFYCEESSIRTTIFARNTANKESAGEFGPPDLTGLGGAVAGYGGTLTLIANQFTANRADVAGGAVFLEGQSPSSLAAMSKNRFVRNRAVRTGGAVGYATDGLIAPPSRSELLAAQRHNRFSGSQRGRGGIFGGFESPVIN
jgi:predicted outer membrane repeat protein